MDTDDNRKMKCDNSKAMELQKKFAKKGHAYSTYFDTKRISQEKYHCTKYERASHCTSGSVAQRQA